VTRTTTDVADVRFVEEAPAPATGDPTEGAPHAQGRFLPLPEPLPPHARRLHQAVLAFLMLFGLAQGVYWAFTTSVWNPTDEVAHFGYVESLATGNRIPTVGVDLLDDDTLASFKATPTFWFRSNPYQPSNADENWGGTRHQYEAIHGPTYYAAMVPAYLIGQPYGDIGSLYGIRFATVALVLLAVPLTWMLARRLFPDRPLIWLLAPGLLIAVNSLSSGAVTNDSMVLVLSIATTVVFLRALDQPRAWLSSVGAGVLFGLTIVTKMTSLVLIPFLALAFVAWLATRRPQVLAIGRFVVLFVVGAVVAFGPWLAWNLHAYRSTSAATVVDGITGVYLPSSELGVRAIVLHAAAARPGVWLSQGLASDSYQRWWELTLVAALVLGMLAAALRSRWRELAVLLWCGSALPLAFLSMEVIVFALFDGTGGPVGRHLVAALAPTMVMVAAAAVSVVGSRWAPPLIASVVAGALVLHVSVARDFIDVTYLSSSIDHRFAPVVYQDWANTAVADRRAITVSADCPVEIIGVGFMEPTPDGVQRTIPSELVVRSPAGDTSASGGNAVYSIPTYRLAAPVTGRFTIELPPGSAVRATTDDRRAEVAFTTGEGDPVVTASCAMPDADVRSFAQIYPIGHPDRLSLGMLQGFPVLLAAAGVLVAAGLAVSAGLRSRAGASRPSEPSPTADV